MTDISSQTLHLVAKELSATLNEARASLEAYAERTDQHAFLEKCADQDQGPGKIKRGRKRPMPGAGHGPQNLRQRPPE